MPINKLSKVSTLNSADLIPLFSQALGCDAAVTLAALVAFIQSQITDGAQTATQYFAPNASGWAVTVAPPNNGENVYLQITPNAGYSTASITLPPQASCVDGQRVVISTTQAVTTLTVNGNGAVAVNGALAAFVTNGFMTLRYDGPSKSWFRTG